MRFAFACLAVTLAACTGPELRPVEGHLSSSLSALSVVVSETADGATTVAAPSASGAFLIPVRVNTPVRMFIATVAANGKLQRTLRVGPEWFTIGSGKTLDLGEIRGPQEAASTTGSATSGATHLCPVLVSGSGDDSDHHDGGEDGSDDDGKDSHDGKHKDGGSDSSGGSGGSDGMRDAGHPDDGDRSGDGGHSDDGECGGVEVEGCEHGHASCDHEDDLRVAMGPADSCSAPDAGVTEADGGITIN